ncbi:MAG: MGMT family protein [Thermotogota bacterium]|nr:MGMT family protein [Thermotogota bacterium]
MKQNLFERVYEIVKRIPEGKVSTYGRVAKNAGCSAKYVGYALSSLNKNDVPWHRVINSTGKISLKDFEGYNLQRQLLELEGIIFDKDNSVDLEKYLYKFDKAE